MSARRKGPKSSRKRLSSSRSSVGSAAPVRNAAGFTLRDLQQQLLEAKEARKLVEQDAQLLANRISLLTQEEEKAWKKITQTRDRAQEILRLRAENEARVLERQQAAEELGQQQKAIVDRHYLEKEMQKKARQRLLVEKEREKKRAAQEVKAVRAVHKREVERQRKAEVRKAQKTKELIRANREAARKRREEAERERIRRNKVEYDRRVEREQELRHSKEDEVSRLEALEMELIQRLKKTQAQQQRAFEELEQALAT